MPPPPRPPLNAALHTHRYMYVRTYVCEYGASSQATCMHVRIFHRAYTQTYTYVCTYIHTVRMYVQSDLTYPHTSVLDEVTNKVRELDK